VGWVRCDVLSVQFGWNVSTNRTNCGTVVILLTKRRLSRRMNVGNLGYLVNVLTKVVCRSWDVFVICFRY